MLFQSRVDNSVISSFFCKDHAHTFLVKTSEDDRMGNRSYCPDCLRFLKNHFNKRILLLNGARRKYSD
jgi:hypothetical protein